MLEIVASLLLVLGVAESKVNEPNPCDVTKKNPRVVQVFPIGLAWSSHPVSFCLYTSPPYQYVGYYDAERRLVIAARELSSNRWEIQRLPTSVGWDSHNSIVIAVDRDGYVHVAGNMHVTPLIYFRTEQPHAISTFQRFPMVGQDEQRVTYPRFLFTANGDLLFFYRDGASGKGRQFINRYDVATKSWSRLLQTPLLDGGEEMSAYPSGPDLGPDGRWHMCWVWRDTPDCATNHDISYARSSDLLHWETIDGKPIELPITPRTPGVVVDPVPVKKGLINVAHYVGFDTQHRPIVTYHKYDEQGYSQIYNSRWENGRWVIRQATRWEYRWEFSGGGTIQVEISSSRIHLLPDGRLAQRFSHARYGSGIWIFDPASLSVVATCPAPREIPSELAELESDFPGMEVRFARDAGKPPAGEEYVLRWETLAANRDRPRAGPLPPPTTLRLYRLQRDP
ncbi:MAG TPA: BNR repeat-containing protein [Thermogutta sp.]|nr:BNR repeat-containing protein [Thermogutta sp.]HPU07208.1 BNR repeat-containing protein [Thermogutta sp.]HPZ82220.1 BNR repeat-containing protein [Thermogutta sp.]HQF13896.1 BNR repeat-containing protein [Thermogutta sp.]